MSSSRAKGLIYGIAVRWSARVSDQYLHFAFWRSRGAISRRFSPINLTEAFFDFPQSHQKNVIVSKIRPPPLLHTPFTLLNYFYLTCTARGKDSTAKFKIIPVVTAHTGKLTNKDVTQILSRICVRKLWHRNVNFYFIVFIAYFILVFVMRCTSLWENTRVNCKCCEMISVITMETRSFLIAISDGNQERNFRGWQSHEVNMHARPSHSSTLPLADYMTSLREYVSVNSLVLTEAGRM